MTRTTYIGAIDQGTTSTRFIVFDQSGAIVASHQIEHRQIYPRPGWSEHDPIEIWENVQTCIHVALKSKDIGPNQLVTVGITNQRETTVVWDKTTGKPLYNAIVWHDGRTKDIVKGLETKNDDNFAIYGQDRLRSITGLPLSTYFSATKIMWILNENPDIRKKAEEGTALFGTIDTWLLWNFSGAVCNGLHVTDVTNASRTNLMDLKTLRWSHKILSLCNLPETMFPEIRSSSEVYFRASADSCLPNVPIAGVLGDQHAALFGHACFAPGQAKNTYGTGCFLMMNTGNEAVTSVNGLLTTVGYKLGSEPAVYALEGSISYAGALIQWLRDNLKLISSAQEVEELAKLVNDNGGVYIVPAFSGLFAPHWRADARGVVVGLSAFATRNHIARAALEATAFQTQEVVAAMESDSGVHLSSLNVDGGMVVNQVLMQFQSDILDVTVKRPAIVEITALGAAYAAGLAVGFWKTKGELMDMCCIDMQWTADMPEIRRSLFVKQWKKAVERTLDWETSEDVDSTKN